MNCAWCEGPAHAEYVDIGVGMQQVDAARCSNCGAQQLSPMAMMGDNATHEEKRRGWWMGEDTEEFMVHVLDTDRWYNAREWLEHLLGIPENDPRAHVMYARLNIADLGGVVHAVYVESDGVRVFRTRCGRDLVVGGSGPLPAPTCLACVTR